MNSKVAVYAAAYVGGQLAGVAVGNAIVRKVTTPKKSTNDKWLRTSHQELMPKAVLHLY